VIGDSGLNLTIGDGATFSYNKNTNWSFANLTIDSGGTLTHAANSTTALGKQYAIDFTLSGNLTVNGTINVDGKGYANGNGPGAGLINSTVENKIGGGYGGTGGGFTDIYGLTYGSAIEPIDLGSGGGARNSGGGSGGGAAKLHVLGITAINGTISANGGNYISKYGAGGSGGSIWISTNILSGSSSVTANGGNGYPGWSGGGGGGRIALYAVSGEYSGLMTASKGSSPVDGCTDGTVIYDPTIPTLSTTAICSASGNACTAMGEASNPQQAFTVANISGTAQDAESVIKAVHVSLRDTETNLYLDENGNFDEENEYWLTASTDPAVPNELGGGTINWSYDTSSISYALNHTYEVRVRVANPGTTITDNFDTVQFIFVNSPPTVTNVTASQSSETGLVNVTYDVADEESTNLTMRLTYFSGATLSGDLDSSSTDPITISSADIFPSSGYIVLDDETIRYSSKSENTLTGITRGSLNTTPDSHATDTNVYILANNGTNSITGDVGTVAKGTGKTMVWTPTLDTKIFYITEGNVRVLANDGASFSMVGQAQSPNLEIDTKDPMVTLSVDGSTQYGENPSTIHITLTDDTMSEGGRGTMMLSLNEDFSGASYIPYTSTATYMLDNVNDTDTIYWRFKDGYNNITQGQNTLPQRPPHYMVQDTSNLATVPPTYALFTGWAEINEPVSGSFLQYNILRSPVDDDSQYQKAGETVQTAKYLNYYNDSTVEFDVNYYYKVVAEDSNHNISFRSNSSWGKANGTQDAGEGGGGSETTAPTITNVNVSSVTSNGAVITWDTDELSNSAVGYSTTPGVFTSTKNSSSMLDNADGVGQHRIVLSGLSPSTTYYFRVSSTDSAGNISTDNNGGQGYTFTTLSGPTISNVSTSIVRNTQAVITWTTSEASNTYVTYSENSDMSGGLEVGNDDSATSHSYTLMGLTSGTTYYYFVRSGNAIDNNEGNYYSFTTTSDTSLPEINFDPATGITNLTNTSATIQWETNKATSGKVNYKKAEDAGYAFQENTSLNYDHRIDLTGLSPNTTYYFNLSSTDENNNTATKTDVDGDFSFTTLETADTTGPVITDITTTDTTPTSAILTWTTDENSSSFVQYSSDRENFAATYKETGKSDDATTSHTVTIDGLTQNTTYYFKVKSVDSNGNETIDDNSGNYHSFVTASGPVITDVTASPSLNSAAITWTTDSNSNAFVTYSPNADLSESQEKGYSGKTGTNQGVTIEGLTPGTTYYYSVRSENEAKGVTTDDNNGNFYSFVAATDTTAPTISNVSADSTTESSTVITWVTDEAATGEVQYGTSADALNASTDLNTNLNVNHSALISGLEPNTTYYFKVISKDGSGNASESEVNSFTTLRSAEFQHDPLSEIKNVRVSLATDESAVITFNTDQDALCLAEVTTSSGSYDNPLIFREDGYNESTNYTIQHSLDFLGLLPSRTYYYRITCKDNLDNIASTTNPEEYSFMTLQKQTSHTNLSQAVHDTSPTISTRTDTEVVITFNAGTVANSKLCLGAHEGINMDSCEAAASEIERSRVHSYHITGLTPDTLRYAKMRITDSEDSDDTYDTNEVSFRTLQAQVEHISLSSADHDASPTVTMKSDIEAIATFNAGTNATSKLCYSTAENIDMNSCEGLENDDASKLQAFHLTGLTASTRYYVRMLVRDAEDVSDSLVTEEIFFDTLETQIGTSQIGVPDSVAPEISGVSINNVTGESATITWNTNENANSLVAYEPEGATFSMMAGDSVVNFDKEKFTTSHSVQILGLIPSTKYNYKIVSYDTSGNISKSYESSFTTKEPSSLSSIKIVSKAMGQATITWKTSKETTSKVKYGLTTAYGKTEEDNEMTRDHEITISDLTAGETYHLRVESEDRDGNQFVSSDMTFEPKSPPQISDYKVDSITEHGAKVFFTTNIPTDAIVTYTDPENEENSGFQGRPELTTKHEIELKNMASGVKFSIKIKVRDEEGNETEEEFEGFTTAKDENPPKIDEVRTDSALTQSEKVQTIISWKTDEPATTSLIYKEGRGGQEKEVKISDNFTTGHIAVITSFKLGTVYYVKVKSEDQNGNVAISGQYSLLTPQRKQNIIQIIASNFQEIFGWVGGVK
jgi:Fe-S cluster assembly iron-binding protein IscA